MKPVPDPRAPVAVVGMGGVFPTPTDTPGPEGSLERFWSLIASATDAAREPPAGRWALAPDRAFDPRKAQPDRVYSRRACFVAPEAIDEADLCDALRLAPTRLASFDPSVRLALRAALDAWRDAITDGIDRARVGVFLGNLVLPSESSSQVADWVLGRRFERELFAQAGRDAPAQGAAPTALKRTDNPAAIVARTLGLGGAQACLDAACASSLFALKHAADELQSGRADLMLAGGLSRPDPLFTQMGFSQLRALSARGRCSPFDSAADGIVVGEGAGVLLLKRLDDALAAGDSVYAVVRGIGLSNDVDGNLLAPSQEGQLRAMRGAFAQAGWRPSDVDLIECHATGTPIGDQVEHASLRELWSDQGWRPGQCVIGSVKSNVGHLLTGAGAAGLIKTLLALRAQTLPPTANFSGGSPQMGLGQGPFRVLSGCEPWPRRAEHQPRRAAVSGFGFGGTNAHVLLEEYLPESAPRGLAAVSPSNAETHGVAGAAASPAKGSTDGESSIVGLGAQIGPWPDLDAFAQRLFGADDAEAAAPQPRDGFWGLDDPPRGWFIEQLELPLGLYRIPPKEIEASLPQQMLMLDVARRALADAGLATKPDATGNRTGVYIGLELDFNSTNYHLRWTIRARAPGWARQLGLQLDEAALQRWTDELCERAGPALDANRTIGGLGSIVASRIAREFGFGGPSYVLCSAATSGVSALASAVQALDAGEIDRALVGAVDLRGDARALLADDLVSPLARDGRCRPFEHDAAGSVPADAAVALVLERQQDAERAGRRRYANLRGLGLASGPCEETAQLEAMRRACSDAAIEGHAIGHVEAHGSGQLDEDRSEAAALARFAAEAPEPPTLGTTKDRVGHAGAASALVSLAKAALQLYQRSLAPVAEARQPIAALVQVRRPRRAQPWVHDTSDGPRIAAVNCSSGAGQSAQLLLEASGDHASAGERQPLLAPAHEALFPLTAPTATELVDQLDRLASSAAATLPIEQLAHGWWQQSGAQREAPPAGRDTSEQPPSRARLALVARTGDELRQLARDAAARLSEGVRPAPSNADERVFFTPEPLGRTGRLAFVFPGSGSQVPDMGRELGLRFADVLHDQAVQSGRLRAQLQPGRLWHDELLDDPSATILALVSVGVLYSDIVRLCGVQPDDVIGYSLGESTGLFALGAWQQRDEMLRRVLDSQLFRHQLAGDCQAARRSWGLAPHERVRWQVGVVDCPAARVRRVVGEHDRAYLLIVNTPDECVVGGDAEAVAALVAQLDCQFVPLSGVTTVHCEVAEQVAHAYRELHLLDTTAPADVRFYSAARGEAYAVDRESAADAILAQAVNGIDFAGLVERAWQDGVRLFVELGPGRSCTRMIQRILRDRPHAARSATAGGPGEFGSLLRLLGQLWAEGIDVDLGPLYGTARARREAPTAQGSQRALRLATGRGGFDLANCIPRPQPVPAPPLTAPPATQQASQQATLPASQPAAGIAQGIATIATASAEAHDLYLRLSTRTQALAARQAAFQLELARRVPAGAPVQRIASAATRTSGTPAQPPTVEARPLPRLDRAACLEFARGSIARSLGPSFAPVDGHPTRVRLPDEPLMLVDRVLQIDGEPRSLGAGRIVTEHDIEPGAWYLDRDHIPTCIAVEAGQADLMLSAYLGIDFETGGHAVYRLLDATVTFHDDLPVSGETIRYEIEIERFAQQDDVWLFWFHFEATVAGQPLMSMRDGCAGFFSHAHLAAGGGLVKGRLGEQAGGGKLPADWRPLVEMQPTSLDERQVDALRAGDLAGAFGAAFARLPVPPTPLLPDGNMRLVDRVTHLEPAGGTYGLGRIRAEADIAPDAWFLTCHFVDDRVMPGTLMYECCLHTLRILLLRMGWVPPTDRVVYQPVLGTGSRLKCRGQVLEQSKVVAYEISIKELGYGPEPYVIADATMLADGKPIVDIGDMSLRLSGTGRGQLEALWRSASADEAGQQPGPGPKLAIYDRAKIEAFAQGNPSEAFGAPYRPFDSERTIARLPRPPFLFVDRITAVEGAPFEMTAGAACEAQVAISPDDWFFASNRQRQLPFAILLEMALQPCGWLAAYVGSALSSETNLRFRNLGGDATMTSEIDASDDLLTTRAQLTGVSHSGGMIIQHYGLQLFSQRRGPVYEGTTYFGFFSDEALADQVGIPQASRFDTGGATGNPFTLPRERPFPDDRLRMVDQIDVFLPEGGLHGLGFIRGTMAVDPSAWFFQAHFYQDPVWPGSLGLESFLQLLKAAALQRWPDPDPSFTTMPLGARHRWTYRGQILPSDRRVEVEAQIKAIDPQRRCLVADGLLTVDGRTIYQLQDFALAMLPG